MRERSSRSLNLTSTGVTLLGVVVGIGVTVAFGVSGPWWVGIGAGLLTVMLLIAVVKLGTATGRGPVARAADWVISAEAEDRRR